MSVCFKTIVYCEKTTILNGYLFYLLIKIFLKDFENVKNINSAASLTSEIFLFYSGT